MAADCPERPVGIREAGRACTHREHGPFRELSPCTFPPIRLWASLSRYSWGLHYQLQLRVLFVHLIIRIVYKSNAMAIFAYDYQILFLLYVTVTHRKMFYVEKRL